MNCIEAHSQYVVYEWAGEEGSKVLPQKSFDEARALLKQVVMALHALSRGSRTTILHHDLKWQNVAVESGCLKLIDLDDWIPGRWGRRLDITAHTPLFSPLEILTEKGRKNYFCGLTATAAAATARTGNFETALVPCPGAYSFDIYTAGMMALQICGFEWVFFAKFMHDRITNTDSLREQQRNVWRYAEEDPIYETIPYYGIHRLKVYLLRGYHLRDLLTFNPNTILEIVEHFQREPMCKSLQKNCGQQEFKDHDVKLILHAGHAKRKFESCKQHPAAVETIEKMLHIRPRERPDPSSLLTSPLFSGVPTGCSFDAEASIQESERVPTEMTEDEGQDPSERVPTEMTEDEGQDPSASYQDVIEDLEEFVDVSNKAVYSQNSMKEHIGNQAAAANHNHDAAAANHLMNSNHEAQVIESNVVEQPKEEQPRMLNCGICLAPAIMQRLKSGKERELKNKQGQLLGECPVDYNPGNYPPKGCKWRGNKVENNKYVLQCICHEQK